MIIFANCTHAYAFVKHLKAVDENDKDFTEPYTLKNPGNVFRCVLHFTVFGFSLYLYHTNNRLEDHNIFGGLGRAVAEVLVHNIPVPMEFIGVNDSFGESGEPDELAKKYGIDSNGIVRGVKKLLRRIS